MERMYSRCSMASCGRSGVAYGVRAGGVHFQLGMRPQVGPFRTPQLKGNARSLPRVTTPQLVNETRSFQALTSVPIVVQFDLVS